jgi:hypothetical protein
LTVIYKLLNDILFLELVFFLLISIAEGALAGIISEHIGFSKIVVVVLATLTAALVLFVLILLVFNSLFKLNILLNLFILIVIITSGYFTYKITLED